MNETIRFFETTRFFETMNFFSEYPMARIAEEDQQNAASRDAGYPEAKFYIDEMGIGHVYMPVISTPIILK